MSTVRHARNSTIQAGGSPARLNAVVGTRNLGKWHLGGVIFGCKNNTMKECLSKQLFGLPAQHFSYVKNIDPGLPLFLFNYSDRKMHGIFEAASSGQMNINPYGWTTDGSERTLYPAQVQIRVRKLHLPLAESQFQPIIADNYYSCNHFWFELDHAQTNKLIMLLASQPVAPSVSQLTSRRKAVCTGPSFQETGDESENITPQTLDVEYIDLSRDITEPVGVTSDLANRAYEAYSDANIADEEEYYQIFLKLQQLAVKNGSPDLPLTNYKADTTLGKEINLENSGHSGEPIQSKESNKEVFSSLAEHQSLMAKLVQEVQELKDSKVEQAQKIVFLETRLLEAEGEIQHLKSRMVFSSLSNPGAVEADRKELESFVFVGPHMDSNESLFLIGGYDGKSWISDMDLYDPSKDVIKSLRPMSSARSFASVARLNNEIYVLGGGNGCEWFNTVESYCPENDRWTSGPSLNAKKGSLAGVTIDNKLYAFGGGNGFDCYSDVEMLDLDLGRWIHTRSMLRQRFALAAVELNGVIYATGGFDGSDYLKSAERFDIREHSWTRIACMHEQRGCHSLVTLNEKIYALGGFDGNSVVSSVEVYDPRLESWIMDEPMKNPRGYAAAVVINESICIVGGMKAAEALANTVEIYKEGRGWQEKESSVLKRSFLSAIV